MSQFTGSEFEYQLKRLEDVFGAQHFARGRLDLIKRAVSGLSESSLRRMVDLFISTMRTAPMPKDFLEMAQKERSKAGSTEKARHKCPYCGGTGTINAYKKGSRNSASGYCFKCPSDNCEARRAFQSPLIPLWTEDWLDEYLPAYVEIGPDWVDVREQAGSWDMNQGDA